MEVGHNKKTSCYDYRDRNGMIKASKGSKAVDGVNGRLDAASSKRAHNAKGCQEANAVIVHVCHNNGATGKNSD
jgi:hypothetical protein